MMLHLASCSSVYKLDPRIVEGCYRGSDNFIKITNSSDLIFNGLNYGRITSLSESNNHVTANILWNSRGGRFFSYANIKIDVKNTIRFPRRDLPTIVVEQHSC